ncbi:MAG TPA: hypothetical protein VN851_28130 [Thermoanaerobaculia bacterium]|nr:hypothetical protein [Thermoanaerobaculia bacterium]
MKRPSLRHLALVARRLSFLAVVFLLAATACRGEDKVDWEVKRPSDVPRAELQIRFVAEGEAKGATRMVDPDGNPLWVEPEVVISTPDVDNVHVNLELDLVHYAVTLYFTPQAAQRLHEATTNKLGRQVAILLNGSVVVAPRIQSAIGPSAMISGRYTKDEAVHLAQQVAP